LKPEQKVAFLDLIQGRLNQALAGSCGPPGWPGPRMGPGVGPGIPAGPRGPGAPD